MPKTLTLELPDPMVPALEQAAARAGQTLEQWALERLRRHALTPEERAAALARLMRHAGAGGTTGPADADARAIDADLARSYDDPHEQRR
jgi:hypothetical protein